MGTRAEEQEKRIDEWSADQRSDYAGRAYIEVTQPDVLMLDGQFTVEELKAIVAIMETTPR